MIFFSAPVWIWQWKFCIARAHLSPVQHSSLCQSHWDELYAYLLLRTLRYSQRIWGYTGSKSHLYFHAQVHTHTPAITSNRYFEPDPNVFVFWNLINSRCMSGCVCETADVCDCLCVPVPSLTIISANQIRGYLFASEAPHWRESGAQSQRHLRQIGFITCL